MKLSEFKEGQVLWCVHGLALESTTPVVRQVTIVRVTRSSVTYATGPGQLRWRAQSRDRFNAFFTDEEAAWTYVLKYRFRAWATLNARYRRMTKHLHHLLTVEPVGKVRVPKGYARLPKI